MSSRNVRLWGTAFLCIALVAGCTRSDRTGSTQAVEHVATRSQAFTSDNGFWANALTTNALWQNGFWANGFWANSLNENGFWANGFWANGFWANGFWANGFWANGFWANGFWANGFWANGFWANGLAKEALTQSQYTRQLLQYMYQCAMPPATATASYDTFLDPNNGSLACNQDGTCDAGYECQDAKCVVPLRGSVGIGINTNEDLDEDGDIDDADQLAWWEVGECHESCQRWVSACMLARTNAYGVRVELSMGAPATAPQRIREALGEPYPERDASSGGEYVLQEGEFYGNLFATTPGQLGPGGTFEEMLSGADGESSAVFQMTPIFSACAGPASNIPDMTKRFCSSQGDQTVIDVPGTCTEVCGVDPADSIYRCSDADGVAYEEVITVYLKEPVATPGNGICEDHVESIDGGSVVAGVENEVNSPSDCHPGGWAIDFAPEFGFGVRDLGPGQPEVRWLGRAMSAVSPVDDSIAVVGKTTEDIDLGDGPLPASDGLGVLAKYSAAGELEWATRLRTSTTPAQLADTSEFCELVGGGTCEGGPGVFWDVNGVTVAPNGNIIVTGYWYAMTPEGDYTIGLWVITHAPDGTDLTGYDTPLLALPWIDVPPIQNQLTSTRLLAADSDGNVVLVGLHFIGIHAGETYLDVVRSGPVGNIVEGGRYFMAKLYPVGPPGGSPPVQWAVTLPDAATGQDESSALINYPLSLAIDAHKDVFLITEDRQLDATAPNAGEPLSGGYLRKFSGETGEELWSVGGGESVFTVVATHGDDVYVSGYTESGADLGACAPTAVTGRVPFLAKLASDGSLEWAELAKTVCPSYDPSCSSLGPNHRVQGMTINFDAAGEVVLGSYGNPIPGGGIDFSPSTPDYFPTYHYNNVFVAAYDPNGVCGDRLVWAKQVPTILGSSLLGMALTSENQVVLSGNYSGSMQMDGHMLVSDVPQSPDVAHAFLSSFGLPSPADHEGPRIGVLEASPDAPVLTVPADIYAQATGRSGAVVFYMPPTAIDDGHAGVSVTCEQAPNTLFELGDTRVTCTAVDARGNVDPENSVAQFTVHVVDTIGPIFTGVEAVYAPATGRRGAVVTYPLPVATDQVDGTRPVTCTPPPGGWFGFGTTEVTCISSDTRSNTSVVTFPVKVPYLWSGFLPPIDHHGCSVFKRGSTVPVKFKLKGFSANVKDLVAKLMIRKVGSEEWTDAPPASGTGNVFRYDAKEKQYLFNLSTKNLAKGKWELFVDMGDAELRTVEIQLR